MEFRDFLTSTNIYRPSEILDVLKLVRPNFRFAYTNQKLKYFNVPCSFDIETTSFFRSNGNEPQKVAIMYEWTFGIYGAVIIGRTWSEFVAMMGTLCAALDLRNDKRLIVYVHNLSYEFQFMRKWFEWEKVFSIDSRKPIYALTTLGLEFRCSYLLSGYSLAKLGDELRTYTIKKLVGDLDYEKVRHSETILSDKEIAYCVNDVKIVMAYIAERMEQDSNISRIPLTKTGYVRTYCRNSCFYEQGKQRRKSFKRARYMDVMNGLRLSPSEYGKLKDAFQGGFTHANPFYRGKVVENVTSFDFTSSYPCVMLAEQFPMTSGERVEIKSKEEFEKSLKLYCCLFDIEITGLESAINCDHYISQSRCWELKGAVVDNGRVVSAAVLGTTITEQDFMIIRKMYKWKKGGLKVGNFRRYMKDYLPTDFVKAILKLYRDKTILKGVANKEMEYAISKEMLNSCYGMAVTDIVRPEYPYSEDEWKEPEEPDTEKALKKYNNSRSRFLFYPWGVWVTAYARRNLFTGILECGNDYVYSDTDSIKIINAEKHLGYIQKYNDLIRQQLYRAMDYHGIDRSEIEPETIKGVKKCLGVWDLDGHYQYFKSIGAKRYMVKYSDSPDNAPDKRGTYSLTVSGLNKKVAMPYLLEKYGEGGVFVAFSRGLYVPPEYTGKQTHTYIDELRTGLLTDYQGRTAAYAERSSVHLEKADYSASVAREYADYLAGVDEVEV